MSAYFIVALWLNLFYRIENAMRKRSLLNAKLNLNKALNEISVKKQLLNPEEKDQYKSLCVNTMRSVDIALIEDSSIPCMVNANFEQVVSALNEVA